MKVQNSKHTVIIKAAKVSAINGISVSSNAIARSNGFKRNFQTVQKIVEKSPSLNKAKPA